LGPHFEGVKILWFTRTVREKKSPGGDFLGRGGDRRPRGANNAPGKGYEKAGGINPGGKRDGSDGKCKPSCFTRLER